MSTETVLECPNCHKQGMVRLHSEGDIFECIYCQYTSDLNHNHVKTGDKTDTPNWMVMVVLAMFAALLMTGL